jgi:branched-chain amino acid transport system permease protein
LGDGGWGVPVSLIPLVGGVCGMGFAVVLGYVSTRKSGTTLAMITLGLGELVFAMSLMFSDFFGGEAGLSGNRVQGAALWGIDFKSPIQVYYLIGAYTWLSVALMYAFTQTPLGRLLNAARDNAERLSFIGYQPQRVRYLAFIISGFFAGVSPPMWWALPVRAPTCCSPFWADRVILSVPCWGRLGWCSLGCCSRSGPPQDCSTWACCSWRW